ncbi:MAG: UvrD-helicase domain-containing protein [Treponema sp.]|nr:UvrD-helicase domain-containing protein [Treponema sp.]
MSDYSYLDLLEKRHKKLDDKQRAVCCRTDNTIVAAGAGSGKTQVLATRFAWLVMSQNIRAPQILTLTFTKKAAGEMYERIYQTLDFFANDEGTPALEKKRATLALEEFSDTHIQTLDSYCNSIVKQAANRYGIRPDFNAGGSDSLEDIKKLALPYVLENKDRPCIQQYAQAGRLEDFAYSVLAEAVNKYTTLADDPDFFVSKLEAQKELLLQSWNWLVCGIPTPECNAGTTPLKALIPELQRLYKEAQFVSPGNKFLLSCHPALDFLDQLDTNEITSLDDLKDDLEKIIKGLKLVEKITLPSGKQKVEVVNLKDVIKPFRDSVSPTLLSLCAYIQQLDETTDLYKMFDDFSAIVNDSKRQTGNLTFADISELALKILNEQEDLRTQEQNAYEKIMIDEFQDNNAKNKELLFLLNNSGQKLFFVGDEKQSIYKFRGADVSVFNKLKTELGDDCFLQMNYNYRSNNNLLTTFNRIFGENDFIFDNQTEELYEAKYSVPAIKFDPATQKELPAESLTDVQNRFLSISRLDPDALDPSIHFGVKDQLAISIAKTILEFKKNMEDQGKEYGFSKFAILDRGRTDRRYLIKWLNVFNIPYTMDMNTSIFSDGPINDIYNFIQLCVYPQDRISLAGYLASPFANLSEETVEAVLAGAGADDIQDETERAKYQAAMDFYKEQKLLTLSRPLTKTLELLWNECGYRYETMFSYRKSLYEEQFDMLFELARQTDLNDKGIAWFSDQLSQIKNKEITSFGDDVEINFDELTYPIEKGDAVNIMTIHKSKGLQFGYVFVYGCTNVNKKSRDSQFFFDQKYGLTVKPGNGTKNYFFMRQEEQAAKEELAEFRRLIYVAITRAEDYVEIVGSWKAEPTDSWEKEDSLRLIEKLDLHYLNDETKPFSPFKSLEIIPVEREEMKGMLYNTNSLKAERERVAAAEELYKGEPAIKYEWPESNRKTPSSLEKEYLSQTAQDSDSGQSFDSPEDTLQSTNFTAADFGTLVHAFLEAQAKGIPCDQYQPESKLLKNLPDSPVVMNQFIDSCKSMCQSFAQSDLGKALDECKAAGRFYRAEWVFRMLLDGFIFTGSIDLIFENPDGTYTIVDYKSDKEIDIEKYRGQQECYRKAAAKLLKISEEKISCWLYFLRHSRSLSLSKG